MAEIRIEKLERADLEKMGVFSWPIWEKEASTFDWRYHDQETCYILAGQVRVEPAEGEPVEFGVGDLVVFPKGMDCVWIIREPVRKHYKFG